VIVIGEGWSLSVRGRCHGLEILRGQPHAGCRSRCLLMAPDEKNPESKTRLKPASKPPFFLGRFFGRSAKPPSMFRLPFRDYCAPAIR
jgi:hypothetical protein